MPSSSCTLENIWINSNVHCIYFNPLSKYREKTYGQKMCSGFIERPSELVLDARSTIVYERRHVVQDFKFASYISLYLNELFLCYVLSIGMLRTQTPICLKILSLDTKDGYPAANCMHGC